MRQAVGDLVLAIAVLWLCLVPEAIPADATRAVKLPAGQTADLWLGVNVTGKVYYAIRTKDGRNKMRMWWITEPLGSVKQLGTLADRGSLNIPNKMSASLSAKLRGKAVVDTIVYISENIRVDNSATFKW